MPIDKLENHSLGRLSWIEFLMFYHVIILWQNKVGCIISQWIILSVFNHLTDKPQACSYTGKITCSVLHCSRWNWYSLTPGIYKFFYIVTTFKFSWLLVSGCVDCNKEENILTWEKFMKPRINFGVPLEEMVVGDTSVFEVFPHNTTSLLPITLFKFYQFYFHFLPFWKVKKLIRIYAKEKYILMVNQRAGDFEVFVSFKVCSQNSLCERIWMPRTWPKLKFPCRWELQVCQYCEVCGRFIGYMRTGRPSMISLTSFHIVFWWWRIGLMISSNSWKELDGIPIN